MASRSFSPRGTASGWPFPADIARTRSSEAPQPVERQDTRHARIVPGSLPLAASGPHPWSSAAWAPPVPTRAPRGTLIQAPEARRSGHRNDKETAP
jgi:hypothetical protein